MNDELKLDLCKVVGVTLTPNIEKSKEELIEELLDIIDNPNNTPFQDY